MSQNEIWKRNHYKRIMQAWSSVLQLVVTRFTLYGERSIKILEQGQANDSNWTKSAGRAQLSPLVDEINPCDVFFVARRAVIQCRKNLQPFVGDYIEWKGKRVRASAKRVKRVENSVAKHGFCNVTHPLASCTIKYNPFMRLKKLFLLSLTHFPSLLEI